MAGNMRNFIQEISQLSICLKKSVLNRRLQHADFASQIVAIELANGPCDTKAADLKKMYETNENFEMEVKKAKKTKTTL